jgi:hypothetical protein
MRGVRAIARAAIVLLSVALYALPAKAQWLLVPMDRTQADHLRAYGLTYWVLERGNPAEWLLNYRGGSFLLPDAPSVRREAALRGVTFEPMDPSGEARMRATIDGSNMESVPLERAPKIAIYTPPNSEIWDDAVTMALEYAGIGYETIWDDEVLGEGLSDYEWIHLHHEDFTGQYSKFFLTYAGAPWLQEEVSQNEEMARRVGARNVPELKRRVAEAIRAYVEGGGFLFAMCSATETLELALAAAGVDIAAQYADGTPADPNASAKMDWGRTMAFTGAQVHVAPNVNAFSDIDAHQVNTPWRRNLGVFTLFDFSAKFDPVPAMLTQNHVVVLPDFYGLTTSFSVDRLKSATIVLASEEGAAKYVHGNLGEGTWTYFGGHDPEDAEHQIGDPPTDLSLHPNSPGYRLILNNVLFPAAKKQQRKT